MKSLPTLRQLQYLIALSKHLHFTQAAEALFVSQSTLSAGLRELEVTLGVQLLERDRQTVSLTLMGAEIAQKARTVLTAALDLVDHASSTKAMHGKVCLGVIPTIAPFLLPQTLSSIRAHYPHLKIALREDLTINLLQKLYQHELDFALIALPFDTNDLLVKELFSDPFWLIARKEEPIIKEKEIKMYTNLANQLLLLEDGHCLREHTLRACRRKINKVIPALEATSILTLVHMVESGLGLALLPSMAIQHDILKNTNLRAAPLQAKTPARKIALVTRKTTAKVKEFMAIANSILANKHPAVDI